MAEKEKAMTNDELAGRLAVIEVLAMSSLSLLFSLTPNDAGHARAIVFLDSVRDAVKARIAETGLSSAASAEALAYLDYLSSVLSENLPTMRPHTPRRP